MQDEDRESIKRQEKRGKDYRLNFLRYPGEDQSVDYKAVQKLESGSDFSYMLVKAILGMTNAGGGFIVLGVKENGAREFELENIDDETAASYETSDLSHTVEKCVKGAERIELLVHKDKFDNGITYPIIEVFGFQKTPFFCRSDYVSSGDKKILKNGALYIRVPGTRTVELASPDDWERLINLCVEKRRDEFSKSLIAILSSAGIGLQIGNITTGDKQKKIDEWFKQCRDEVENNIRRQNLNSKSFFEVFHFITHPHKEEWGHEELKNAAEKSVLRNTGWPIGITVSGEHLQAVEDGVKAIIPSGDVFDYWYLRKNGSYYFARTYEEDTSKRQKVSNTPKTGKYLYFDTRIWRIAEVLQHCALLYKNLNTDPLTQIKIVITHFGLQGRELDVENSRRFMFPEPASSAEKSTWEAEVTLEELAARLPDFVKDISRKLFILFGFWKPEERVLDSVIEEFYKSHV